VQVVALVVDQKTELDDIIRSFIPLGTFTENSSFLFLRINTGLIIMTDNKFKEN
jgi:hypothetical protein